MPTESLYDDPTDKRDIEYIESAKKHGDDGRVAHSSATLAAMPMAPSADLLAEAVTLSEEEKVKPASASFKAEICGVLFCLAYVFPALAQGFDNGAANIAVNMPAFLIKFGDFNPITKSLYMPSLWLGLFNAMTSLGNAIGSFATGALTDRFGYRTVQLGACAFSVASIFLQVFAVNNVMIVVGKLLNGIPMGLFMAISAGYISEVLGPRTRAFSMASLGAAPLLGIIAGISIGSISSIIGNVMSDWGSWKLILALQWVLPTVTIPLVLIAPESPTQLVKRGSPERAIRSLRRLRPRDSDEKIMVRLASVQLAVATSIEDAAGQSNSYADCFKGVELKRTLTVIVVLCGAQFSGVSLLSNGLYFLAQTGLEFSVVSQVSLAFLGLGIVLCLTASLFVEKIGRRRTMIWGSLGHAGLLILIGCLHYAESQSGKLATAILFNLAVSTAQMATTAPTFAMSVEISSLRLRAKTQSLGFAAYYIVGWVFLFTVPYMYQAQPAGAGWGTRSCWVFAILTILFAIFAYFFAGETKGRSAADIDLLYQRKVPARKFHLTEVSAERDATS